MAKLIINPDNSIRGELADYDDLIFRGRPSGSFQSDRKGEARDTELAH